MFKNLDSYDTVVVIGIIATMVIFVSAFVTNGLAHHESENPVNVCIHSLIDRTHAPTVEQMAVITGACASAFDTTIATTSDK
jgi:hypothetical protein